jgi:hypothetical protein
VKSWSGSAAYCEELRLAFEYQGEYHYMYVPVHHREHSLADVQKIDAFKLELCKSHDVTLIQIPYWEKGNLEFIIHSLKDIRRLDIDGLLAPAV